MRVGIIGFGVIGGAVAEALLRDPRGLSLVGVAGRDEAALRARLDGRGIDVPVLPLAQVIETADVLFDSAVAASLPEVARAALSAGRTLVTLNSGALLANPDLFQLAEANGARIIVPSGGVVGLDGIRAAAAGSIRSLRLISRKPPESLAGAPHIIEQGFDLSDLAAPFKVFEGDAIAAARAFPANANVAATLSLAGPGPQATIIEMWADPHLTRISQQLHLVSAECELRLEIFSNPMAANPRTGSLTPLSAIAALRSLAATVRVGS